MTKFIDFDELKARVSLEDAMRLLGLDLKKRGAQYRGTCPACEGSTDRALVVTPGRGFYCFTAKQGGDQIALAAHIKGIPANEAAHFLSGTVPKEKKPANETKPQTSEARGFKELDYLEADHDAVVAFGLDPEDAKRIGVGYAKRGVMRGTVAWPVRLSDGTLIGYIGLTEAVLPGSWRF